MEGAPKQETIKETESIESVERARELYSQLKGYEDTDIVGRESLEEVEAIASALSAELQNIPPSLCMQEGLPYHPMDIKSI